MFYTIILNAFTLTVLFQVCYSKSFEYSDYKEHGCIRDCLKDSRKLNCEYNFTVEWYVTLSRACFDCPINKTDCSRKDCVAADGHSRDIMVVNRMLPGPAIQVCEGDTITVNVDNNLHLAEETSIHWHGVFQKGTPYMDGVGMITQCPIPTDSSFQYKFVAENSGTHMWHAHSGIQRSDGVFGALVVRDRKVPSVYDYNNDLSEHVIIINDWFNTSVISKFVASYHSRVNIWTNSILINGKGVYNSFRGENMTDMQTPRAQFKVTYGQKYRFRIINAGSLFCPLKFSIDGHKLTVIATDGNYVEPAEFDFIVTNAGERYDFIVNANNSEFSSYLIRVKGLGGCAVNSIYEAATLIYTNSPSSNPIDDKLINSFNYTNFDDRLGKVLNPFNTMITNKNKDSQVNVDQLKHQDTAEYSKYKREPDHKHYLEIGYHFINNREFYNMHHYPINHIPKSRQLNTPQINNISMMMPPFPPLYQWDDLPKESLCNYEKKTELCNNSDYCNCLHSYEVKLNDMVELVIFDIGSIAIPHPMHLHGHSFAVVGLDKLGDGLEFEQVKKLDREGKLPRNLLNPPLKDTVTVPSGGYAIIRFIADNPGIWMLHCHLEFHSSLGMSLLFKVGDQNEWPKPPGNWRKCGSFKFKDERLEITSNSNRSKLTLTALLLCFLIDFFLF